MFDVFQNVFGGKKKSEPEKAAEADEFVMIGSTSGDKTEKRDSVNPNDMPPPYLTSPYLQLANNVSQEKGTASKEQSLNTLTIQDVPFVLNSSLNINHLMNKICLGLESCLASSSSQPSSLQMDYDFSLEKSVLSETN